MADKYFLFFGSLVFALLVAGGFFIAQNNPVLASDTVIHDGRKSNHSDWQYENCDSDSSNSYLVLKTATSSLRSPELDLASCASSSLDFKLKAFNGISKTVSSSLLLIKIMSGSEQVGVSNYYATGTALSAQSPLDLSAYCGGSIRLEFISPQATGYYGIGLDDIVLRSVDANKPPVVSATSSQVEAVVDEEIFFDGTGSSDDGGIISWHWDFGDGRSADESLSSHSYGSPGLYAAYLGVTDGSGLTATSAPLYLTIRDAVTVTSTDGNTTSSEAKINVGDLVINEVYPSPLSSQAEWLEIFNDTTSTFDLSGVILLNLEAGKFVTTTLSGTIGPSEYKVIEEITGSLNNSGDTIILKRGEEVISQTAYGDFSGKSDASWSRSENEPSSYFETMTVTKGLANIITARPARTSSGGSSSAQAAAVTDTITVPAVSSTNPLADAADYQGKIIINELLPNPIGPDEDNEFIELKNISTSSIDVRGFVLTDAIGKKHVIKSASSSIIQSGGLLALWRSSTDIALNNSGIEAANLYGPDLKLIDSTEYLGEKEEGLSWSLQDDGKWQWVKTATPSEENARDLIYDEDDVAGNDITVSAPKAKSTAKKISSKSISVTTIENLGQFSAGAQVRVKGIVTSLPGQLGTQFFTVSGFDAASESKQGAQVYSYKKDFPELKIGDLIQVTGELAIGSSGQRIKISGSHDIKIEASQEGSAAIKINTAGVDEDYENNLVTIEGVVLEIKSRNMYVADDDGEAKVYLKAQIDLKDLNAHDGDKITVTGIVSKTAAGYRLVPRDLSDIKITAGQVRGDYAVDSPNNWNFNSPTYYLAAIAVFLALLLVFVVVRFRKK